MAECIVCSTRNPEDTTTCKKCGNLLWSFPVEGEITSSPLVDQKDVTYVASDAPRMYAIDRFEKKRWGNPLGARFEENPTITAAGTLLATDVEPGSDIVSLIVVGSGPLR